MANFTGFPKATVKFFTDLNKHNDKIWFEQHKDDFDNDVMAPARVFVAEMGERLKTISPQVNADPRVNKSIFKLHRDTRFSPDKTPFKTHLGLIFWEGNRKRMECSCYYFHLEPPNLFLGAGLYSFPKPHLEEFRKSVIDSRHGPELIEAINAATQLDGITLCEKHYKKTPRGYDPDHERAEFLLFNGLFVSTECPIPEQLFSHELVDFCFEKYQKMQPVHNWLVAMTERVST